jgi:hypothetical protein
MPSESTERSLRRRLMDRLAREKRNLRDQEQRLARLNYEWSIAKRLRHQANNEDEREKWGVQSDAYLGLVLQQESAIDEIKAVIDRYNSELAKLNHSPIDNKQP